MSFVPTFPFFRYKETLPKTHEAKPKSPLKLQRERERASEEGADMSGGDVVCSGWLRKSPPEKKLRRYVSALYILFVTS